jgi:hypothetical protein
MAIKISGTTVINDDSNIINVGVVTVGTGGTDGKIQVGTGATIYGSGDVAIAGTVYAFDVVVPLKIDGFDPGDGSTNASTSTDIKISFNKAISIGSTGYVILKDGSNTILETISVGSTQISRTDVNKTLVINPSSDFAKGTISVANTITAVVQASFIDNAEFTGINTTGGTDYSFEVETVALGDAYEGGYFICSAGGVQWIVAPAAAEVSRTWGSNDANTLAQSVTGCTGWFVPTSGQLYNPGYICREFWDSYSNTSYWSSTQGGSHFAPSHAHGWRFNEGSTHYSPKGGVMCVRSFRCVTY